MAEAVALIGIAASVVQLASLGWQVVKRINDYQNSTKGVPSIYQEIAIQLPQVIHICTEIKDEDLVFGSTPAFARVVEGCIQHVSTLDALIARALPKKEDSTIVKVRKAVASARLEKKLLDLQRTLESYKGALILELGHRTNSALQPHVLTTDVPAKGSCYYFPSSQVSRFIGREKLLGRIDQILSAKEFESYQPVVAVLIGMGGQGKTQLALEYSRRSQKSRKHTSILWINASSKVSMARSFEEIADHITKGKRSFSDGAACVAFVKDTIDGWASPFLIVFDNFDNPSQLKNIMDYCPKTIEGRIIFTTRNLDTTRLGTAIEVTAMEENEAVSLLLHNTRRPLDEHNIEQAKPIVRKLGFLPLAIDQAGAYIKARNLPLQSFTNHYEKRKEYVMKHTPELWDYRKKLDDAEEETSLSVFSTWELSFRGISCDPSELASITHLLTLSAFLSNINIGENIFRAYFDAHKPPPDWMKIFMTDEEFDSYKFEDVIADLARLSLIHHVPSVSTETHISLHPLVRDWIQLRVPKEHRQKYAVEASHCLKDYIGDDISTKEFSPQLTRDILSHVDTCCINLSKGLKMIDALRTKSIRDSVLHFARFYNIQGHYRDSQGLLKDILTVDEAQHGINNITTLQTRFHLAEVYHNEGRYHESEKEILEILSEQEKQLGFDNPVTLKTVTALARVYYREASYEEAVGLYNRALKSYEAQSSSSQADILRIYEDLAMVLRNQGNHEAAIELYQKTLAGYERLHGHNNFQSLKTMVHLANAYRNQTLYDKTLPLYQRALEANEKRFGPDHLNTLENTVDLAINFRNLGEYSQAEALFSKALIGIRKVLGESHPTTLRVMMNLAINHHKMGNYTEAETLYLFVLEGREKVLGWGHHYTWRTVECLADLQWIQGRPEEAEKLAQRCMRGSRRHSIVMIEKRRPTEQSPERNSTRPIPQHFNTEPYLSTSREFQELEALFLRALHRDQTNLKGYHADKLDTMTSLANIYVGQGRYDEAQKIFLEVLEVAKKRYGLGHRDCARVLLALSDVNELLGDGDGYDSGLGEDLQDFAQLEI